MINYFKNKQIYYLAIDGTCSYPATPPTSGMPVYTVPAASPKWGSGERSLAATASMSFRAAGGGGRSNPCSASDLSDQGYYAVVGQYGVQCGSGLPEHPERSAASGPWPVAELAHVPAPRRSRQRCCCWPPGCWACWPMPGESADKRPGDLLTIIHERREGRGRQERPLALLRVCRGCRLVLPVSSAQTLRREVKMRKLSVVAVLAACLALAGGQAAGRL